MLEYQVVDGVVVDPSENDHDVGEDHPPMLEGVPEHRRPNEDREHTERALPTHANESELAATIETLAKEHRELRKTVSRLKESVEGPDLSSIPTKQLLASAYRQRHMKNHKRAVRMFRELLSREGNDALNEEQHHGASQYLAYSFRELGMHEEEGQLFSEIERKYGIDSKRGASARYQRAWSSHYLGRNEEGRALMREASVSSHLDKNTRDNSRLYEAVFAERSGDIRFARERFETLLEEYADKDSKRSVQMRKTLAYYLKKLDEKK